MFQSFEVTADPSQGGPRLARLREYLAQNELDGFLIPRADAHQGEYVADADDRLAWLTGFTGSAGFCVVLKDRAGVFIDGRYRTQVRDQVDLDHFTPVDWPETKLADWLLEAFEGQEDICIGFDPWLHTVDEIEKLNKLVEPAGIEMAYWDNAVDEVWHDRPARPASQIEAFPLEFSGKSHADKCNELAADMRKADVRATILTLPDSICWLLNIRGSDIPHNPIIQCFAILHDDASVDLFTDAKEHNAARAHFADLEVSIRTYDEFGMCVGVPHGRVQYDPKSAPAAVLAKLRTTEAFSNGFMTPVKGDDPCALPKALKNDAELAATTQAHLRDGAAMVEFLAWFDANADNGKLTEIDVVTALEKFRRANDELQDISFETIAGTGANGAIIHYRVSEDTNAPLKPGDLLVLDSGGQYLDGTTDITRTLPIGDPSDDQKTCFTRVLQGVIAVSRARFPKGIAGCHLDALARAPLWTAGQDYDHGTGHGVGVYLSVHEGPQRLSRTSDLPLQPGMILSNEPGYYRVGEFGIRIENLIYVRTAPEILGGDKRDMLDFVTLTFVPIDRRLIDVTMLSNDERKWVDAYHRETFEKISPRVSGETLDWLTQATAPL